MRIVVNGEPRETAANTLQELLEECGYLGTHFATAVNEEFVHKQQRTTHVLNQGDRVEVVAPMEGG